MKDCILCGCELTDEEIELGFDVCEPCEDDDGSYGAVYTPQKTKMRVQKEKENKVRHRPRGVDKFDSLDTSEISEED